MIIGPASSPVSAQVNPNGSAVQEQQLLNQLKTIQGLGTIPDTKSYVLEHPAGRDWQYFHNVTLRWIAAIAIVGLFAVLVIFYLVRGSVKLESGFSGRKIVRFNWFERFVHWMTAVCFIILGLTGLNITFGRPLLLPLIGADNFTAWSEWAKYAHNFLSFPFTIGVVLIGLIWFAGNIPNRVDVEWLKEGGGIVGDNHPAADRFNAGQKVVYWVVVLGGRAGGDHRLHADVPVLRHHNRHHAARRNGSRGGRRLVHRFHARPHLYRHHRHGGRVRGNGRRHRGRQLGERASQPVAVQRDGTRKQARSRCAGGITGADRTCSGHPRFIFSYDFEA